MYRDYLWISANDLAIELAQLQDEGKELPPELEGRLRALAARGDDYLRTAAGQTEAGALLDETIALSTRTDYDFSEPSDLEEIRRQRPTSPALPPFAGDAGLLHDKVRGAWLGRVYGCYLGKPVEGLRRRPGETFILEGFLKQTGQWPLPAYFSLDYPDDLLAAFGLNRTWRAGPPFMPEDDDTNYTLLAFSLLQQKGRDFSPADVAAAWLVNLPIERTYTAERVAYRNFCLNLSPPVSARFRNVYREWIGAQIRADFFGYAAPGNPQLAAEYAWRDGCISHVKNGLYGEMWVAAMLAAAYVTSDLELILRAGLGQAPACCRLTAAIEQVFSWRKHGLSFAAVVANLHQLWDENNPHHWCHTISNAQVCAAALLWSEGDYATAISRAVLAGFDTDCNGATVGSVLGLLLGEQALPLSLLARLNDRLRSGVQGFADCSISEVGSQMARLIEELTGRNAP